jgi:hypothetical protein
MNLIDKKNLLLFSLAAETFFASYGLLLGGQTTIVSILYLMAGLVFIFTILRLPSAGLPEMGKLKKEAFIKLPLLLLMLVLAFITSRYWLDMIPIDPDYADMLPIMKVMNERFLHGNWKQVYDPIQEIWNGTRPIYLPAMWFPYVSTLLLNIDMRWVTVATVLFSFSIVLALIQIRKNKHFGYILIAITALLFWWLFSRNEVHNLITMSEEGVVIFYFVLLTLAIISGNGFLIGLTASLCILSRYSLIGWIIPCLLFFAFRKEFKKLAIFSFTGIVCFLLFFLIPFGFQTLHWMLALPENYIAFAKHIWEVSPEVYWLNLGLAKFYGPHHIVNLHYSLIIMSFSVPVIFMCFCLFQKKWQFQNINLACFKLSILVFYQFIDVPYGYLFYTSSFVSLIIAASLFSVRV